MAFSLNRAQLIGNLGSDPDYKTLPSGTPLCKLNIATTDRFKNAEGDWQEKTEWHNVVLWRRQAEVANEYLKKGSKVFIEGKISTRTYEKDGITRYFTEIVAQSLIMLDSKGNASSASSSEYTQKPADEEKPWQKDLPEESEEDDDIPF